MSHHFIDTTSTRGIPSIVYRVVYCIVLTIKNIYIGKQQKDAGDVIHDKLSI